MRHEYYSYNKEQLLSAPKIPMEVLEDKPAVFQLIAREMADEIKAHNDAGRTTVFICPVGPIGQYPYFVEIVNRERISRKTAGSSTWTSIWARTCSGSPWTIPSASGASCSGPFTLRSIRS